MEDPVSHCASVFAWSYLAGNWPEQLVIELFAQYQQFVVCCPYGDILLKFWNVLRSLDLLEIFILACFCNNAKHQLIDYVKKIMIKILKHSFVLNFLCVSDQHRKRKRIQSETEVKNNLALFLSKWDQSYCWLSFPRT